MRYAPVHMSCNLVTITPEALEKADNLVIPKALEPLRMVVALSGGVDSAVAAWMLKEAGHEVIGVSLRLAPDHPGALNARQGRCCSADDMTDARQLCDKLGIPFYAIDARNKFKEAVFDPFVQAYKNGYTPIPCLACNHVVKFGDLHKTARSLGAHLATGHYARVVDYHGIPAIARPYDSARDQTYFLYGTDPSVIKTLHLPLGDLDKPTVRALGKRMEIQVAQKPDSQEICFVPDGDHAKVVERALGQKIPEGDLITIGGQKVGEHKGIHHYTIGQRRGMGVGFGKKKYVVGIDAKKSQVIIGDREDLDVHHVSGTDLRELIPTTMWPEKVSVQIRARSKAQLARYQLTKDGIEFHFDDPVFAVAPGQSAVVYDGEVLLGGAQIIK